MHSKPWMTALTGLAIGLVVVATLPKDTLFVHEHGAASNEVSVSGERWACPMMDYIGNQPGDCPVCGMTLQRVTQGELTQEQQQRMGVELSKIVEGPATVTVRAHGIANYDNRFTQVVIPRVAGRIVKRYEATYGCCEDVEAGAPIIDLYSTELISAQGELAGAVQLGNPALIAALRERFVRWNFSELADHIIQGGAIRDVVTVRSPFSGQVMLRDFEAANEALEVGREVMADTSLIRLVDPDRLVVVVQVPETRTRFLDEGQPVSIQSDELGPLPKLEASIARVSREIDPELRTREVRIYIQGSRDQLQPGSLVTALMRGALNSDLQPGDPLNDQTWGRFPLVPKTAVLSTGVRNVAWRVANRGSDGRISFELAPITLGPRLEDENGRDVYVVRSGLQVGDEVATQGAFLIDSQAQLAGTASLLYPTGASSAEPAHQH
jgi:Cu(I)/Ag(I) efflux system membrane fusion protein